MTRHSKAIKYEPTVAQDRTSLSGSGPEGGQNAFGPSEKYTFQGWDEGNSDLIQRTSEYGDFPLFVLDIEDDRLTWVHPKQEGKEKQ